MDNATLHNILSSTPDFARVIVACLTDREARMVAKAAVAAGEIPADVLTACGARNALNQMIDVAEDMDEARFAVCPDCGMSKGCVAGCSMIDVAEDMVGV